ncbi:MAG TPA: PilZ domain-containing protein [Clostridiales bacterium]|nr:PilZ domain-containing protein [Clostridiales bacterium]
MLPISYEYESSICEIKTKENVLLAVGMIKEISEDYIKISEKNDNSLQLITCGTEVKINIISAKNGFRALSGEVFTSTRKEMKITNVIELIDRDRRNFFRVDLDMEALVIFDKHNDSDFSDKIPVIIKDMSLCGLRIEVNYDIEADSVVMVELVLKGKTLCYQCRIIRLINRDDSNISQYGCEFLFNKYDDRDAIWSYLFQKQSEQLRKNRQSQKLD